jgi:hypothetical protein
MTKFLVQGITSASFEGKYHLFLLPIFYLQWCIYGNETLMYGYEALIYGYESRMYGCESLVHGYEGLVSGYEGLIYGYETLIPVYETLLYGNRRPPWQGFPDTAKRRTLRASLPAFWG